MRTFELYTVEECRLIVHGLEDADIGALVELLDIVEIGGKWWSRKLVGELYDRIPQLSAKQLTIVCDRWRANAKRVVVALGALRNRCQYWKEKAAAYERRQASGAA